MHKRNAIMGLVLAACVAADVATAGLMNGPTIVIGNRNFEIQNGSKDWSLTPLGSPPCVYRFDVRAGDVWPHDVQIGHPTVERSELSGPIDATNVGAFGPDIWTAYRFKIEPGPPSSAEWVVLGDWHAQMDPGDAGVSSSWQVELLPGDVLAFDTRTSTEKPIRTNPHIHDIWKSSGPIARGVWHALVSRAVFDWHPDGEGAVDLWLDGRQVVNYRGPVGYNTARPPYFKFGIYRAPAPESLVVDYANVKESRSSLPKRVMGAPKDCRTK